MNGADIKQKRTRLGLTQKEFSDALGLSKYGDRTLRRWENGESTPSAIELTFIKNFPETPPYNFSNIATHFLFADLFAGIGGLRLPFQELGGKCVFTSEWDTFAKKTYRINFGDEPHGDITQVNIEDIPHFDILLAGFPCQPFSQAGLRKGFNDTRGTLFFEIEKIIQAKRPSAFLLENVKQLGRHNKGHTIKVIEEHLRAIGYSFETKVLRAADFGVPQNRERLFIVGFDNARLGKSASNFSFPLGPKTPTRLGDILDKSVDTKYTIGSKLYEGHIRRKEEHIRKGNGFGFSLFNEDSIYTNTLSARYYKDGSEILIEQRGNNPRKLTPRECARLQGFPENFIIPVSDTQAYKQFGNSVAVPVVRALAKEIINYMTQEKMLAAFKKK